MAAFQPLAVAAFAAFSAAASYTDLKSREIPDWINYSFAACGFLLVVYSVDYSGPGILWSWAAVVAAWTAFAYLVYRLGAWAGGDVKFVAGMASFAPLFGLGWTDVVAAFFASVVLLVPVMVLAYWGRVWRIRKAVGSALYSSLYPAFAGAVSSYAVVSVMGWAAAFSPGNWVLAAALVVFFVLVRLPKVLSLAVFAASVAYYGMNAGLLAALLAIAFAFSSLPALFSLLSARVLRYDASVDQLREGDVPAKTLVLKAGKVDECDPLELRKALPGALAALKSGKGFGGAVSLLLRGGSSEGRVIADALSAGGLSGGQIKELKRAGVKSLAVKRTLPFAPVLAAGFLACAGLFAWLAG